METMEIFVETIGEIHYWIYTIEDSLFEIIGKTSNGSDGSISIGGWITQFKYCIGFSSTVWSTSCEAQWALFIQVRWSDQTSNDNKTSSSSKKLLISRQCLLDHRSIWPTSGNFSTKLVTRDCGQTWLCNGITTGHWYDYIITDLITLGKRWEGKQIENCQMETLKWLESTQS